MDDYILETCYSLKDAVSSIKNQLLKTDEDNHAKREWYLKYEPESKTKSSMEEDYKFDDLYLVYRNDNWDDEFLIFDDDSSIEIWLDKKFHEWELWDYGDPNAFLEKNLSIWKFHRDILKEEWGILFGQSRSFIQGWSRKKISVTMGYVPSFEVG